MRHEKFPVPTRIGYVPSPYEPDEDGVQDIGYCVGRLSDGRSFRVECWRMEELIMATVMFSDIGLEGLRREDMDAFLGKEGIVSFAGDRPMLQANRAADDAGQSMWMVNVMLRNGGVLNARLTLALSRYM